MAAARSPWLWIGLAAAAIAAGTVAAILGFGEGDGQPTAPLPENVGIESDVRFELITGSCGYEVVVTADTTVDPQNGQFCLVRMDVRNRGDVPRSFDASCQYLIDASGGRHTQREDVLPLDEVTRRFFGEELGPGTQAQDVGLYYDVPKDVEAAEVELHASCDSPGVSLEVLG